MILNLSGHGSAVADIANLIITPFQRFADIVKTNLSGFTAYFTEFNRMKDKIADLEERLGIAESLNEDSRKLKEQNDMLSSFYELKKERTDYNLQPAKIIAKDPGNYLSYLTINKGSFHNIEKDMPVIAAKEIGKDNYIYIIVGYVSEVGLMSSKVVPFIRTGSSIGGYIGRTEEIGIVEGEFELEKEGICRWRNLSKEVDIEAGDKIYSSGMGSIYPEDLYIGEVTEVEADLLSHTMKGRIKPAADFNEIKDVMVILKFERSFY